MKWFQDDISKLDTVGVAHKYQCESAITGPTDKGDGGVGDEQWLPGPLSRQPGPKVVLFSDFTCAHFQETMSLFSIIKTTCCFIFS